MEYPSEDIMLLSKIIADNTRKVADYLSSQKLPFPSFNVSGPLDSCVPADAEEVELARQKIIDATQKLQDLMLGPRDYLQSFHVCFPCRRGECLYDKLMTDCFS